MKQYILKKIAVSALADAWGRARKNKATILFTMVLDALFLASVFFINRLINQVYPQMFAVIHPSLKGLFTGSLSMFAGVTLVILIYSLFKLAVMHKVCCLFEKKCFSIKAFWSFFFCSMRVFIIFFVVFMLITVMFTMSLSMPVVSAVSSFLTGLTGLFFYLIINTAHSLFFQQGRKKVVMRAFSLVFNRFRIFISIIVFTTVAFFLLAGAYYLLDWAVLKLIGSAITTPAVYLGYAAFNTILMFTLGFGLLAFNRVYFYSIVEQGKRFIMDKG